MLEQVMLIWNLLRGIDLPLIAFHFLAVTAALIALLHALIAVFALIPGPHPEDWLKWCEDRLTKLREFVTKFSRK